MAPILAKPEHSPTQLVLKYEKKSKVNPYIVRKSHYTSYYLLVIKLNKIIAKTDYGRTFFS